MLDSSLESWLQRLEEGFLHAVSDYDEVALLKAHQRVSLVCTMIAFKSALADLEEALAASYNLEERLKCASEDVREASVAEFGIIIPWPVAS